MAPQAGAANPLRCDECGRVFGRGEHLRRHRRIHTREKPYGCHCGQSFARRDLLTRHQRLHHVRTTPISGAPSRLQTPETSLDQSSGAIIAPDISPGWDVTQEITDFLNNAGLDLEFNIDEFIRHDDIADADHLPWHGVAGSSTTVQEPGPDDVTTSGTETGTRPAGPASKTRIPVMSTGDDDFQELKPFTQPWKVTEQDRRLFARSLEPYSACMNRFMLPSRLSMARYVAGFVDGFTHHHPFVHMPTFRVTNYTRSPELVLALLAVGAQYRYEYPRALYLYRAGRSIVLNRMQSGELSSVAQVDPDDLPSQRHSRSGAVAVAAAEPIDTLAAMLLLATFASWQSDSALVRESLEYQPLLSRLARDCGLCEEQLPDHDGGVDGDDWLKWVPRESGRRVKLSVFTFLNMQSIALGLPPVLLGNEINLRLPTSCRQWLAQDQQSWLEAREEAPRATYFRDMLSRLCAENDDDGDHFGTGDKDMPVTTPFGNFVLIHALLQRLIQSWQFSHTFPLPTGGGGRDGQNPLHNHFRSNGSGSIFERSLRRWRDSWQKAPESLLDLTNSKDSLSWSATSLLGLAHVRVYFDLGGRRSELLQPHNPRCSSRVLADVAFAAPAPARGPHLLKALLHSVHALSVPAQLGIHYLSNCHAFFLSLQHAFCFFECAVFLSKWLFSLCGTEGSERTITDMESQVVNWAVAVVSEVQVSQGLNLDDSGLPPILGSRNEEGTEATHPARLSQLAIAVVDIFAQIFSKCNSAWPAMAIYGDALEVYSSLLSAE